MILDRFQLRVLGALIEKEIVTPETYPLSLNALLAACNQRSSRDPVMDLSEDEVRQALHTLEDMGLTAVVRDGRVPKYEHRARTVLNLRRDETAVLCLLLLRGPQTPGELRARADRLYSFDGLEAVESTLSRLTTVSDADSGSADREIRPLVTILPRQPGSREARYMHLLGGTVESAAEDSGADHRRLGEDADAVAHGVAGRLAELEAQVAMLQSALAAVEGRLAEVETAAHQSHAVE